MEQEPKADDDIKVYKPFRVNEDVRQKIMEFMIFLLKKGQEITNETEFTEEEAIALRSHVEELGDNIYSWIVNAKMDQDHPRSDLLIVEAPKRVVKVILSGFSIEVLQEFQARFWMEGQQQYLGMLLFTLMKETARRNPTGLQQAMGMWGQFMKGQIQEAAIRADPKGLKIIKS